MLWPILLFFMLPSIHPSIGVRGCLPPFPFITCDHPCIDTHISPPPHTNKPKKAQPEHLTYINEIEKQFLTEFDYTR